MCKWDLLELVIPTDDPVSPLYSVAPGWSQECGLPDETKPLHHGCCVFPRREYFQWFGLPRRILSSASHGDARITSGFSTCVVSMRVGDHCPSTPLEGSIKNLRLHNKVLGVVSESAQRVLQDPIGALSVQHYGGLIGIVNDPLGCGYLLKMSHAT